MNKLESIDQQTYVFRHNKAVNRYKRTALFLSWAGLINVIATIIEQFRYPASYAFMFSFNGILSYLLGFIINNAIIFSLISSLLAFVVGGLFLFFGYYASLGHKWALLTGAGLYLLDFISLLIFFPGTSYLDFFLAVAVHISFCGAFFVAIFSHEEVLSLEKRTIVSK